MKKEKIIKILYKKAKLALEENEVPVAALIVNSDEKIIAVARNNRQKKNNVLGHAEIIAIQTAEKKLCDWRLDGYSMYVTLAPCKMCQEVIRESRLDKVYYICESDTASFSISNIEKLEVDSMTSKKFINLLTSFFNNIR